MKCKFTIIIDNGMTCITSALETDDNVRLFCKRICDLPCIFLEKNTSTRLFMDQFLSQKGIELKPEFELATSDMIVQFARRNMGVGCVMEGFAEEAIERGEVFALSFKEKMPSRSICLVTGESGLMSMAGKHLLELLTGK